MKCPLCWLEPSYKKPTAAGRAYTEEQVFYFHLQNEHKRTMEEIESLKRQAEAGTIGRRGYIVG